VSELKCYNFNWWLQICLPWRWRHNVLPKRRNKLIILHSVRTKRSYYSY